MLFYSATKNNAGSFDASWTGIINGIPPISYHWALNSKSQLLMQLETRENLFGLICFHLLMLHPNSFSQMLLGSIWLRSVLVVFLNTYKQQICFKNWKEIFHNSRSPSTTAMRTSMAEKRQGWGLRTEVWLSSWILTSIELAMFRHSSMPGISSWMIRRSLHFITMVPSEPTNLQQDRKKEPLRSKIF